MSDYNVVWCIYCLSLHLKKYNSWNRNTYLAKHCIKSVDRRLLFKRHMYISIWVSTAGPFYWRAHSRNISYNSNDLYQYIDVIFKQWNFPAFINTLWKSFETSKVNKTPFKINQNCEIRYQKYRLNFRLNALRHFEMETRLLACAWLNTFWKPMQVNRSFTLIKIFNIDWTFWTITHSFHINCSVITPI